MKKALIQMHLAVLLWGFTGVLGRAIQLDAPVLVWYRMLLTAVFMLVILLLRRQQLRVAGKDLRALAFIGTLIGIHWVAFYGAIQFSNASIALVCLSTASVFTTLLDVTINKNKYDITELGLGLLALAGVYLIYRFQQFYGLGILFGVIAAVLSAVFTVLNKRIAHKYPSRTMVLYEMSTGWLFITLLLPVLFYYLPATDFTPNQISVSRLLTGFPASFSQPNDWIWLIILAFCCTVWAQSLALSALKKLSAFTTTLTVNLEPVYGIILAVIFFREDQQLNWGFYAGMGLICLSVLLQMLRIIRQARKKPEAGTMQGLDLEKVDT